jgi:hypothetical protein
MTTITQALDASPEQLSQRLASSVYQALTIQQQQLQLQQEQMKSLSQLLSACANSSLDQHCLSAIERLTTLLDRHQASAVQTYSVLNTLTQAKDAHNLTIDSQGAIAACLNLSLAQLAQRLGIDKFTKLSTAAHNHHDWLALMAAHPDPDQYQWQFPSSKRGFYHNPRLPVIGTKTVEFGSTSSLN